MKLCPVRLWTGLLHYYDLERWRNKYMALRNFRMRQFNHKSKEIDTIFPQTVTRNVLRNEREILEDCLIRYDNHVTSRLIHVTRARSMGSANELIVNVPDVELVDNLSLLIELHIDLEIEPTISYNGSPPVPIVTSDGNRIAGGQIEGSFIFVVYNERMKKWFILNNDHDNSLTHVMIPMSREYVFTAKADNTSIIQIPGFSHSKENIMVNYNQTILRHKQDFDFVSEDTFALIGIRLKKNEVISCTITSFTEVVRKGSFNYTIEETTDTFICKEAKARIVPLPKIPEDMYYLQVNYNQTILRNGIDYTNNGNGTITLTFDISKGDAIVFSILRYVEKNGTIVAPNGGSSGTYRYNIKVIHEEFTSSVDNTIKVIVPKFNRSRDELSVIYKNHLLVRDVDYIIDELSNIILTSMELMKDETLYFTILQGAVIDVPKFNYCEVYGDGKDMKANISYSELHDFYTLVIRPNIDLKDAPTLKLLDGPREPIVDAGFRPISGGNLKGTFIYMIKNQSLGVWQVIGGLGTGNTSQPLCGYGNFPSRIVIPPNSTENPTDTPKFFETVISHGLGHIPEQVRIFPCEPPSIEEDGTITFIGDFWAYADENNIYVGNSGTSTSRFKWEISDASLSGALGTIESLNKRVKYLEDIIRKLGQGDTLNMEVITINHKITDDTIEIIPVENFDYRFDILMVNYMQSMLRLNIDYTIDERLNAVRLVNIKPRKDDVITFLVTKPKPHDDTDTDE